MTMPEVTQQNLHVLLPMRINQLMRIVCEAHPEVKPIEALRQFYHSSTYRRLEREETKLWHLGPVALFEELMASFS